MSVNQTIVCILNGIIDIARGKLEIFVVCHIIFSWRGWVFMRSLKVSICEERVSGRGFTHCEIIFIDLQHIIVIVTV